MSEPTKRRTCHKCGLWPPKHQSFCPYRPDHTKREEVTMEKIGDQVLPVKHGPIGILTPSSFIEEALTEFDRTESQMIQVVHDVEKNAEVKADGVYLPIEVRTEKLRDFLRSKLSQAYEEGKKEGYARYSDKTLNLSVAMFAVVVVMRIIVAFVWHV